MSLETVCLRSNIFKLETGNNPCAFRRNKNRSSVNSIASLVHRYCIVCDEDRFPEGEWDDKLGVSINGKSDNGVCCSNEQCNEIYKNVFDEVHWTRVHAAELIYIYDKWGEKGLISIL
jgi:hypothetical protein